MFPPLTGAGAVYAVGLSGFCDSQLCDDPK